MLLPGVQADTMLPNEVACDFCGMEWELAQPMYEGRDHSMICVSCLCIAFGHLFRLRLNDASPGTACTLCGATDWKKAWPAILHPGAIICARCVRRAKKHFQADPHVARRWRLL